MNKNIKIIFFMALTITIAVILMVLATTPVDDNTEPPVAKPNVVSQSQETKTEPVVFDQKKWQQQQDVKMAKQEQLWFAYLSRREVKPMNTSPSYLEAYRDFVYYEGCSLMISNALYDQDPFQFVIPRGQKISGLPIVQQLALEKRLDKCVTLSEFSEGIYYAEMARNQLRERYQGITPKTAEEHSLKATLQLIKDYQDNNNLIKITEAGKDIDVNLRLELWEIRRGLEQQMPDAQSIFGGYSEDDQLLVDQLNQQIAEVDQRLLKNKQIDEVLLTELKAQNDLLTTALLNDLVTTPSSDAYLAVYGMLTEQLNQIEAPEIESQLIGGMTIIPKKYAKFLTPVVVHFRACELLHPCDQNSPLAENLCLDFFKENAPSACEVGVIDYYLNQQLSPNQLLDVEHILTEGY